MRFEEKKNILSRGFSGETVEYREYAYIRNKIWFSGISKKKTNLYWEFSGEDN